MARDRKSQDRQMSDAEKKQIMGSLSGLIDSLYHGVVGDPRFAMLAMVDRTVAAGVLTAAGAMLVTAGLGDEGLPDRAELTDATLKTIQDHLLKHTNLRLSFVLQEVK